jgi:glycosyltransferase involved in cell wall biosynthesis
MQFPDTTGYPPELGVITVVKNDTIGFSKTLKSLETQSLPGFNWVVIDGSTDKTSVPDLLRQSKLNVDYFWVEPDGIYPAMNQGAKCSTGRYLYFLNAGDTLFESSTLNHVATSLSEGSPAWAFGTVNFWDQSGHQLKEPLWDYSRERRHRFARGRFPAHQSVFVRRDIFKELGGLDTTFDIAADYHMISRLSQGQDPLILDFVIANFTQGGVSTVSWHRAQIEFRQVRQEVFSLSFTGRLEELFFGIKAYAAHLVVNQRTKHE